LGEKTFTIIVVDDDHSLRNATRRLLNSNGYKVVTFGSAEELLGSEFFWNGCCLLLDIHLPGISGLDLYKKLTSSGVKCPVIFMTAHDEKHWLKRAEEAGAVAFLRKPFDESSLISALAPCNYNMN
jgi:FixJ family two-component response regulator